MFDINPLLMLQIMDNHTQLLLIGGKRSLYVHLHLFHFRAFDNYVDNRDLFMEPLCKYNNRAQLASPNEDVIIMKANHHHIGSAQFINLFIQFQLCVQSQFTYITVNLSHFTFIIANFKL